MSSFDTPTDLITKSQIAFRQAAGLSSLYNNNSPNPPSLSTLEPSISSLDPSPPHLRCKYCDTKLLRGLQSLICVYCGKYQKMGFHPDPIYFKSTIGYSWLLQSLNFNGSERIGSLGEGSGVNVGQSPAEDEITLSELLDLKVSLPDDPEKLRNNFDIKSSEHNSSLNVGTTDFDNFFTKSKPESATVSDVREEQPVLSKADQNKIVDGQESLASDWSAEFQFADAKMENEKPESVDLFKVAEADLSTHMDLVFGQTETFDFQKPNDGLDPFQDDLFANMGSATFQENEQLDSVVQAKVGLSGDLNDFNLETGDADWFSDGNWQKSSVKNTLNEGSLLDNTKDSSTDWFETTNWQKDTSNNNTATINNDNLFDIKPHTADLIQPEKSDLDSSDKHYSDITDWSQNDQWAVGGTSSATNIMLSKDDDDDDDGFGEWNAFTGSTGNQDSLQDSLQDSWKESGKEKVNIGTNEKMSESNLFQSTVDSEVDFGSFLQSDIFSSDKKPNDSQAGIDIFSEVSTTFRNANTEAGNSAGGLKDDVISPNATTSSNDDVQMLISQMHDLSFMLKNELSVPSKTDDIGTSHS